MANTMRLNNRYYTASRSMALMNRLPGYVIQSYRC